MAWVSNKMVLFCNKFLRIGEGEKNPLREAPRPPIRSAAGKRDSASKVNMRAILARWRGRDIG